MGAVFQVQKNVYVDTATAIGKVVYKHGYQFANQAAHVLANYSYYNKSTLSWLDEPPRFVVGKLVDDVNVF